MVGFVERWVGFEIVGGQMPRYSRFSTISLFVFRGSRRSAKINDLGCCSWFRKHRFVVYCCLYWWTPGNPHDLFRGETFAIKLLFTGFFGDLGKKYLQLVDGEFIKELVMLTKIQVLSQFVLTQWRPIKNNCRKS